MSRPSFARRVVPWLASLLLLCAALPAFALGLGQIVVKSKPGQPLVAEIPIVSSDPDELQGLQAQLASPETFARVGLAPPDGLVADLDFSFEQDSAGRPLIRVTTQQPVQVPALTFLLEVDWGSGRLVREYSALVDMPESVAAPAPEPVQMPMPAPADVVERAPEPATPPAPVAQAPTPEPAAAEPAPTNAIPPSPPPAPVAPPAPAPVAASAPNADGSVAVREGDTLGRIARDLDAGQGHSLEQTMLALLRANPEAFIGDNVNLVKAGAVLRVPDAADFDTVDRQQAAAIVQQQVQRWRGAREAPAQAQPGATNNTTASGAARDVQGNARAAGARLEIVPPSASDARRAGTRSGIEAGGEGDMLRQELEQAKENLAARDAEVTDLKSRVAELEKLQKDQQQLISMKDSALANAQQDLAKARTAQSTTPAQPAQPQAQASAWWPWLAAAIALALLGAWWWNRSRKPAQATPSRFDSSSLAAAVPNAPPADIPATSVASKPAWTREESAAAKTAPVAAPAPPAKPVWQAPQADTIMPLNTTPAGRERLQLARAYLDMGDLATARTLLQEVAAGGDVEARVEAQRLLGGIV